MCEQVRGVYTLGDDDTVAGQTSVTELRSVEDKALTGHRSTLRCTIKTLAPELSLFTVHYEGKDMS